MTVSHAYVCGLDRPFGAEIGTLLEARGFTVATANEVPDRIDVLIFNRPVAGGALRFDSITDADFDTVMDDMVYDVAATARRLLPRLAAGSRIVLVGSRGHLGAWGGVHLMAASAALAGMMRCMALEFAGRNVSVNLVAAGLIHDSWDTPAARRHVATVACLLAEADTGLVGETLIVDGGRSLRMSESKGR